MSPIYMNITEYIGYAASLLVMISFVFKNLRLLRVINTIGCSIFILYGILLNWSVPIIATNVFIVTINLYHLNKPVKTKPE